MIAHVAGEGHSVSHSRHISCLALKLLVEKAIPGQMTSHRVLLDPLMRYVAGFWYLH